MSGQMGVLLRGHRERQMRTYELRMASGECLSCRMSVAKFKDRRAFMAMVRRRSRGYGDPWVLLDVAHTGGSWRSEYVNLRQVERIA